MSPAWSLDICILPSNQRFFCIDEGPKKSNIIYLLVPYTVLHPHFPCPLPFLHHSDSPLLNPLPHPLLLPLLHHRHLHPLLLCHPLHHLPPALLFHQQGHFSFSSFWVCLQFTYRNIIVRQLLLIVVVLAKT